MSGGRGVNYSKNTYCTRCGITQPLGIFRCTVCNNQVRTRAKLNKGKLK